MDLILQVFVIFAAGALAAEVFRRSRLPVIVAEMAVGVALGPHALGWIHVDEATSALASLGIVVLMFTVGLEVRITELTAVGTSAVVTSLVGAAVTFATAAAVIVAFGYGATPAIRTGVALAATSVGITARVLSDLRVLRRRTSRVILGAAVVDDVVALIALSLVVSAGTSQSVGSIVASVASALAFLALIVGVGPRLARRHGRVLGGRGFRLPFVFAIALCLGLAALSERVGLAAIVGAFLAGMVLAETREHVPLERSMQPLYQFLVPFFFVISGARVDIGALRSSAAALALALGATTIFAKFAACSVASIGLSRRERLFVGAGMIPRGEVTIAAATAALATGNRTAALYAAVVAAVFASSIVAPILLRSFAGPDVSA